jgi:tripartite-type tricarboxylate transporter receptor subunit TctC
MQKVASNLLTMKPFSYSYSRLLAVAIAIGITLFGPTQAQDFPSRSVSIVVPFGAGGGVDITARLLAEKLRTTLGGTIVVENKAGGSGMIGAQAVVKAAPDGHTLLLGSAGETAINPFVYKGKMQYDPTKDLVPVTLVVRVPNVLVVTNKLPVKNTDELITFAKKNPGKLSYSTSGVGNPQHLNGELLEELAGIFMVHIPYRGAAAQLVDVSSGVVDMTFVSYTAAKAFIQTGKVKPIAVTSATRTTFAPDLPALAESKPLAKYQLENWFGLFAPAGTPDAVVQKLNSAVTAALKDPDLAKKLREQGGEPAPMSSQQFKEFIKKESVQFERIVSTAKIVAE